MIKAPIVFVLGAGASSCYGFPLGQKLCEIVIDGLQRNKPMREELMNTTRFPDHEIDAFRRELLYSAQNSIDAFLENRPEYLAIGKSAMAIILMRYEHHDILWQFSDNNWMRYLFDKMRATTLQAFSENQVAFVTFNFDRSLEYFLFNSLRNTFGAIAKDCAQALTSIPIIHLHGRLGWLPWQGDRSRAYEPTATAENVQMCVDNIKLVHEELKDGRDKDFEEAKRLMHLADRIYFLGFGFGQLNVARLGLAGLTQNKAIATATGFTQHEVAEISKRCGGKISIYPGHNIESLFRNVVAWS